jgi:hypothetical protein
VRIVGIVLTVVGTLFALVGLSLGFTKYDLRSSDELTQFLGGVVCWGLVGLAGVILIVRGGKKKDKDGSRPGP